MDWFTPIDLYCERQGPEFWAEPVNALTNVSFMLAALWCLCSGRQRNRLDPVVMLLCALAAAIGTGSFLFHTCANLWSSYADVVPIWTFFMVYVVTAVTRLSGRPAWRVGGVTGIIMTVIMGTVWFTAPDSAAQTEASTDLLNGSGQYAPALIALWFFAAVTIRRRLSIRPWIVGAAAMFTLSLTARTMDLYLCPALPVGTHFLWHILNGLMVALLLQGLLRIEPRT